MGRQDCAGVWGGTHAEDHCTDCDTDSTNDCVQDCAGVWGGSLVLDQVYRNFFPYKTYGISMAYLMGRGSAVWGLRVQQ